MPDLVIEVLSPGTALRDKTIEFELYERYGTREYWLVDPDALYIEVWRLDESTFARFGVFRSGGMFESAVLGQMVEAALVFK